MSSNMNNNHSNNVYYQINRAHFDLTWTWITIAHNRHMHQRRCMEAWLNVQAYVLDHETGTKRVKSRAEIPRKK